MGLHLRGTGRIYGGGLIFWMLIGLHNWGRIFSGLIYGAVFIGFYGILNIYMIK